MAEMGSPSSVAEQTGYGQLAGSKSMSGCFQFPISIMIRQLGAIIDLPVWGLNIVCCSSSIAEKKSAMAWLDSVFGGSEDVDATGACDVEGFGDGAGGVYKHEEAKKKCSGIHFAALVGAVVPFLVFLSAASLFVLYSILFCSKLGSLRYSSRAPTSDTGACPMQ